MAEKMHLINKSLTHELYEFLDSCIMTQVRPKPSSTARVRTHKPTEHGRSARCGERVPLD